MNDNSGGNGGGTQDRDQSDFNRGGMVAFAFSMAFSILYFGYVAFFSGGIDLKEVSPEAEAVSTQLAGAAAAEVKDVDVSGVKEPWIASNDMVAHGRHLYKAQCALCHGPGGEGNGPAGAGLNPKPRNLVEGKWKKGGSSLELYDTLTKGLAPSAMASYAHLPPNDRWSLVAYVRSISQNKVADNDADLRTKGPTLK